MGEEIPERLDYKPAQVRVIRNIRPKYVCPCCSSVAIAPVPMQLFPKSLATSSLTAMDVQAVIGIYIDSIAARLPYRLRNDVGVELRTLLMEQLAAAADAGRAPDEKLAVDLVRGFGLPEEVAARYSPRGFEIIEPAHARVFVTLSAVCVVLQWAFTLPAVFALRVTLRDWWRGSGFGALAWGACWSSGSVSGRGFIAPAWFLGFLTHNGTDTSWTLYDEGFRRSMLPVLIVLMVVRLALCAMAGVNARLRARLDLVRFALWVCFVGLLIWTVFGWTIFGSHVADALFKVWLQVYLLVNVIQIVVWSRRALTRVRFPAICALIRDRT